MKQYLRFTQYFLLFTTTFLASSALLTKASLAATFAFSKGALEFTDFSHSPLNIYTDVDTDTISVGQGGSVQSEADAIASFTGTPPGALASSSSTAFGKNKNYSGQGTSEATLRGIFDIDQNTLFSFNFVADLALETLIDQPPAENARASGEISFALFNFGTNSILDSFSLKGNLTTLDDNDVITSTKTGNVIFINSFTDSNFGGQQESAIAYVDGSLQRYFTNKTRLALVEFQSNDVRVTAPEPSTILASLFVCSLITARSLILKNRG